MSVGDGVCGFGIPAEWASHPEYVIQRCQLGHVFEHEIVEPDVMRVLGRSLCLLRSKAPRALFNSSK